MKMSHNIKCNSLTDYEKIFSSCYWGNLTVSDKYKGIGKNRNIFIRDFSISKYIGNERINSNLDLFDHCELYKCKEGYVYITSPSISDVLEITLFQELGFKKYHNLYSDTHLTYFKKFLTKTEFNRFKKNGSL